MSAAVWNGDHTMYQAKETGLLWKFYAKRFTLAGKPVEPPKNRFRYALSVVAGFFEWLFVEAPLKKLWLIALILSVPFAGAVYATRTWHHRPLPVDTIIFAVTLGWALEVWAAMVISIRRCWKRFEKKHPRVVNAFVIVFFIGLFAFLVNDPRSRASMLHDMRFALHALPYFFGFIILFSIIVGIAARSKANRAKTGGNMAPPPDADKKA